MMIFRSVCLGACVLLGVAGSVLADAKDTKQQQREDARKLAAKIDQLIAKQWKIASVKPAEITDDAAYHRRLSLDLTGRTRTVREVRDFLNSASPDKREQVVEQLLGGPGYVQHFTNVWREVLLPGARTDFQRRALAPSMENWLRNHFAQNTHYDEMARELIAHPLQRGNSRGRERYLGYDPGSNSPLAFYQAQLGKPEELAAQTARIFLGVRLECAQCHDHPFAAWTREQFWSQAAFFAGIRPVSSLYDGSIREAPDRRELAIPGTKTIAQASFLDGKQPRWKYKVSARTTFVDWMTAPDNKYFARTAVNRVWAHFFGVGLVDPVDNFGVDNPPSHPELLDELARQFVEHDYDLHFLIRAITYSKAYQLSSEHNESNETTRRLFAQMPVKRLSGEQLYACVVQATGVPLPDRLASPFMNVQSPEFQFLTKFESSESPTERQTSIPQALAMMNSDAIKEATDPHKGKTLSAIVNASFMSTPEKIETLYLAVLNRKPRETEVQKMSQYVDKGGAVGDKSQALADVYWTLLNSTEFFFNR